MKLSRATLSAALALMAWGATAPAQTYYDPGDPTPQEQWLLTLLNRARQDPAAEGVRVAAHMRAQGIAADGVGHGPDQVAADFAGYGSRPPLAMNRFLLAAARAHSADMAAHGVLTHDGSDGSNASGRDTAAGYPGLAGFETAGGWYLIPELHFAYLVENYNLYHATDPLGHRNIRLDLNTGVLAEVGVGLAPAQPYNYETSDFGLVVNNGPALMVGTAYQDLNGNGSYDPGEGIAGVRVSVDGGAYYTLTGAAGGYAVPLVRAANGQPFEGAVTVHLNGLPDGERSATLQVIRRTPLPGNNFQYYGPYRANVALDARVPPTPPPFFALAADVGNGFSYLPSFGYFKLLPDNPGYTFHNDLGFLFYLDANDGKGGISFYDFATTAGAKALGFLYTSPSLFPYLYSFEKKAFLYYFPDTKRGAGFYTTGPRVFVRLDTGEVLFQ